eukprot:1139502-Pelagomonas_calceolata.AAC.4
MFGKGSLTLEEEQNFRSPKIVYSRVNNRNSALSASCDAHGKRSSKLAPNRYLAKCQELRISPVSQVLKFLESQEMHITHYGLGLKGTQALLSAMEVGSFCNNLARPSKVVQACNKQAILHSVNTVGFRRVKTWLFGRGVSQERFMSLISPTLPQTFQAVPLCAERSITTHHRFQKSWLRVRARVPKQGEEGAMW